MAEAVVRHQNTGFGRDFGLIHEVVVTGRKLGADHGFWAKLAHDPTLFQQFIEQVNGAPDRVYVDYSKNFEELVIAANIDTIFMEPFKPVGGNNGFVGFRIVTLAFPKIPDSLNDSDAFAVAINKNWQDQLFAMGMRSANYTEALTFMAVHSDKIRTKGPRILCEAPSTDTVCHWLCTGEARTHLCVSGFSLAELYEREVREDTFLAVEL